MKPHLLEKVNRHKPEMIIIDLVASPNIKFDSAMLKRTENGPAIAIILQKLEEIQYNGATQIASAEISNKERLERLI